VGSTFDRCTFARTRVEGGNWSQAGLAGADLRRAAFRGVRLEGADLSGARCEGAELRDADLRGADLAGARFAGCDLRGSTLDALAAVLPAAPALAGAVVTPAQALVLVAALGVEVRED
jgi:uncharacterized protein YjbI with pentapeptide repeats